MCMERKNSVLLRCQIAADSAQSQSKFQQVEHILTQLFKKKTTAVIVFIVIQGVPCHWELQTGICKTLVMDVAGIGNYGIRQEVGLDDLLLPFKFKVLLNLFESVIYNFGLRGKGDNGIIKLFQIHLTFSQRFCHSTSHP